MKISRELAKKIIKSGRQYYRARKYFYIYQTCIEHNGQLREIIARTPVTDNRYEIVYDSLAHGVI